MSYPNMSYCMCENTLLALRQVTDAMQGDPESFLQNMSREEKQAFQRLMFECENFLTLNDEINNLNDEEEYETNCFDE
jgi:hypothetical protein